MDYERLASELIRALRGKRSQTAFSRRLGSLANVVYTWESGRRFPTAARALWAAERAGVDVKGAVARFYRTPPAFLEGADLFAAEGVARLLEDLRGRTPIGDVAVRAGRSRFAVSRWLRGEAEPRLPDFLRLIEATSLRGLDFVAALVDPANLPSIASAWSELQQARRAAYEMPWSQAILRVLELDRGRERSEPAGGGGGAVAKRAAGARPPFLDERSEPAGGGGGAVAKRAAGARPPFLDERSEPAGGGGGAVAKRAAGARPPFLDELAVPGAMAAELGISADEAARCLETLERTGQIRRVGSRYVVDTVQAVDTRQDPEAGRRLESFWSKVALERLERDEQGLYSYSLFTVTEADYQRLRQLHLAYFRELRSIVAQSSPAERVVLANVQLLSLFASNDPGAR